MKIKGYFAKAAAAGFALLLVYFAGAPVCYASFEDLPLMLFTVQELVEWYTAGGCEGGIGEPLGISGVVDLGKVGERTLTPYFHGILVNEGGELILDNSALTIKQAKAVPVTVESGGTLTVRQPFILDTWNAQGQPTVLVKVGGHLDGRENLPDGTVVQDENKQPPDPPDEKPPINPPVEERDEIANIYEEEFYFSFLVGERPAPGQFPKAAHVAVLGYDDPPLLPLEWDLSYVDFDTDGFYPVKGYFTQQGLDDHKLLNSRGITMPMMIQVYKQGPPDSLRGWALETDNSGNTLIKLTLPALLMEDVTAVYIYRSADERTWERGFWAGHSDAGAPQNEENFRSLVRTEGRSSSIPYRFKTDYTPLWLRVEIKGSEQEGISNSIYLSEDEWRPPEHPPEEVDDDDDDNGWGNRGGVGQEETDRVLPPEDGAKKQAAIPVAAGQSGTGGSTSGTAVTGETADKPADSPLAATPVPGDTPVMAEPQPPATDADTPAKPAIPGAVTAAVCTTGAVAAASVLLKFNWKSIVKFIQRKP